MSIECCVSFWCLPNFSVKEKLVIILILTLNSVNEHRTAMLTFARLCLVSNTKNTRLDANTAFLKIPVRYPAILASSYQPPTRCLKSVPQLSGILLMKW